MISEILSPAGSLNSAIAAVNSGCNAIYMGGRAFNARRFAQSPSDEEIKEIIRQCHLRGVKVHITLNTLYKDNELKEVLEFASRMYSYGADAFIVQDLGFFSLAKKYFPNISLHASTQLTAHSLSQAQALNSLGFERVVLSRELTLEEIKHITSNLPCETECFVHGALCVSYSGRCLMSSMLGGRSGNRGSCAQTCRMEYRLLKDGVTQARGYLLSPKDNCMLNHTGELIDAGITSWKIEGRMKSPEYVALVTSMYRKYADNPARVAKDDIKAVTQIFNRGGELSTGYYYSHSGKAMLSSSPKSTGIYIGKVIAVKGKSCTIKLTENVNCGDGIEIWTKGEHTGTNISKQAKAGESITLNINGKVEKGDKVYRSFDKALNDSLKNTYKDYTRRRKVKAELKAQTGLPLSLTLTTAEGITINCEGAVPEKPQNSKMTYEDLTLQLSKTGNTPFILEFTKGKCEELYVPLSALKDLKRRCCQFLEKAVEAYYSRAEVQTDYTPSSANKAEYTRLSVQVYTPEQLNAVLNINDIDIYYPLDEYSFKNADNIIAKAHGKSSKIYFAMPVIEKDNSKTAEYISRLENTPLDGYLIKNISEIHTKKELIADYTLNTFNSASVALLSNSFSRVCLSPELNLKELKSLCGKGTEIVVYGRLPLMTTQQCPVGVHLANKDTTKYCKLRNTHPDCVLRDRTGANFPVITDCNSCTALILNSAPIYVGDKWEDISPLGCECVRLIFTTEKTHDIIETINLYKSLLAGTKRADKRQNVTGGHFFRGVL